MNRKLVCGLVAIGLSVAGIAQDSRPWSANPKVVEEQGKRRTEFNYYESEVPTYELPDPLKTRDGASASAAMWDAQRRGELLELFRDQVYGRRPETKYSVSFRQESEVTDALDGSATGRSIIAKVTIGARSFDFPFVVFIPNQAPGKVPAVVHINNRYFVPLETVLDKHDPFWAVRTMIQRGYATASFHTSNVDPDKKDGYAD